MGESNVKVYEEMEKEMTDSTMPYFLSNKKWYIFNDDKGIAELTEEGKKHKEVVDSYNEYYSDHEWL